MKLGQTTYKTLKTLLKSTYLGQKCLPHVPFCTRWSVFSLYLCAFHRVLGEKIKAFFLKKRLNNDIFFIQKDIILDQSPLLSQWVMQNLQIPFCEMTPLFSIGFLYQNKLVGAVTFSDYRQNHDVWWTIYTCDKHWCSRRKLSVLFETAFLTLNCERINLIVSADNEASLHLVRKLGFIQEGFLRRFRLNDKKDCYLFSMLKTEWPQQFHFIKTNKKGD